MSFVMPKTRHGADVYEVLSALHKSLRRGLEQQAMLFANELLLSGLPEKMKKNPADSGPAYEPALKAGPAMLFNYLITVVHEDVGIADPGTVVLVNTTVAQCRDWHKAGKTDATSGLVATCILATCRAKKARLGCHLDCVARHILETDGLPAIPDYALDLHTRRGKKMGRAYRHFKEVGALLWNEEESMTGDNDPYEAIMAPIWEKAYPDRDVDDDVTPPPAKRKASKNDAVGGTLFDE